MKAESPPEGAAPEGPWVAHALRGFLMGAADVVPGVSGGTVALILGIYTRFIDAVRSIDLKFLAALWQAVVGGRDGRAAFAAHARRMDLPFLLILGLGIGVAVLVGSRVILFVLERQPVMAAALFFGLILASARIPWRMVHRRGPAAHVLLVAGGVVAFLLAGLEAFAAPSAVWFVPIAGGVAICAMMLPGVSGAALLLAMGMYPRVLGAIRDLDVLFLLVFAVGAGAGLIVASRGLSWLLHHKHDVTLAALTGLMLGSLRRVWPFKDGSGHGFSEGANVWPDTAGQEVWLALVAALAGVLILWLLDRSGRRIEESHAPDQRP